jgi:hypothetical protein
MATRRYINNQLHPRSIAQRTSELNCNLRGYLRYLYRGRCEEQLREHISYRVGHTMWRYVPSRSKHSAYRLREFGAKRRRSH